MKNALRYTNIVLLGGGEVFIQGRLYMDRGLKKVSWGSGLRWDSKRDR